MAHSGSFDDIQEKCGINNSVEGKIEMGCFQILEKRDIEIMMTNDNKKCIGRVRGLVLVWEEERRKRNRLWINTCLPPRCGRAEMLKILMDMATQNEQRPRPGPSQDLGRGVITLDADNKPCHVESVWTPSRTPSP